MKIKASKKIIIRVSLLMLVAVAIVSIVIIPTIKDINLITKNTYDLRLYMEKKHQDSRNSRLTKKKIEEIKKEAINYNDYLFQKNEALPLIQLLENNADSNNVIQTIKNTNLDQIKPGNTIQIGISAIGQYLDILKYVDSIESSKYFLNIESINISPNEDRYGKRDSNVNANIIITIYVSQ